MKRIWTGKIIIEHLGLGCGLSSLLLISIEVGSYFSIFPILILNCNMGKKWGIESVAKLIEVLYLIVM
jgi:hypothetical protein